MPEQNYLVHSITRNESEEIRVQLRKYKGKVFIDFRVWFQMEGETVYRPTKRGVTLAIEHLPELEKAVAKLRKASAKLMAPEQEPVTA